MQTYIVRVYRARPEGMGSMSGVIEEIESGQKESFHSINELETVLAQSIRRGQLGFRDLLSQELNAHDKAAAG